MFTPEIWVLLAFVCFVVCFGRKLHKAVVDYIDLYIHNVKAKVDDAERLKKEATELLKQAYQKRDTVSQAIDELHIASKHRLELLEEANRTYLNNLTVNFQKSFDRKVEAVIAQKVEEVKNQVIEQVISELEKRIIEEKPKIRVSRDDLSHL